MLRFRCWLLLACLAIAGISVPAGASTLAKNWPRQLVLGTYPSELPSEELEKIDPIRRGLERHLTAAGYPVAIDIQIFQGYEEAIQAIVSGRVDFVRMGPVNYVLAKARKPQLRLLGMETQNGSKLLTGYIFAHEQSPVKTLKDLRGRSLAFGSSSSTTGRHYPQAALVDVGILARDLAAYRYLGRHDKVYRAVGPAGFDAGASNEVTFRKYGMERNFRIIHVMKSPAHAWLAKSDMSEGVAGLLHKALISLTPGDMALLSRDGIVPATDEDFDDVRRTMKKAERFGE